MYRLSRVILLPFLLLAPGVEGAPSSKMTEPVATLGDGRIVREQDFQMYLRQIHPLDEIDAVNRDPDARRRALDDYLDVVAVSVKAREEGITQETRYVKAVALMESKLLSHMMASRHRDERLEKGQVFPEEVRAYYEAHKHAYTDAPHFTAHQLVVYVKGNPAFPDKGREAAEARATASKALAALLSGSGWDEVAKTYSDEVAKHRKGGLIRDGRFGFFPPEVEQAVKTQPIGVPGEVIRSVFGYHVIEVVERVVTPVPRPFATVEKMLTEQLSREREEAANEAFMAPIRAEMGLEVTEAGRAAGSLWSRRRADGGAILAMIGGKPVLESDVEWFLKDALIPSQRVGADARPGARQAMLRAFWDIAVLAAKARKEGLDKTPEFLGNRAVMAQRLLVEFMQARDGADPLHRCGSAAGECGTQAAAYFARVRNTVGLEVAPEAYRL